MVNVRGYFCYRHLFFVQHRCVAHFGVIPILSFYRSEGCWSGDEQRQKPFLLLYLRCMKKALKLITPLSVTFILYLFGAIYYSINSGAFGFGILIAEAVMFPVSILAFVTNFILNSSTKNKKVWWIMQLSFTIIFILASYVVTH
jgi:hypothetical protein